MRLQTNQFLNSVHHFLPKATVKMWSITSEFRRLGFEFHLGRLWAMWTSQDISLYYLVLSPANRQNITQSQGCGRGKDIPCWTLSVVIQPHTTAELLSTCPPFWCKQVLPSQPHFRLSLTQQHLHPSLWAPENVVRLPQGLHPKHICSHFTQLSL